MKKKNEILREIKINEEQTHKFETNLIKTAKYNFITFLPLSILYQFTNYFNIFFLATAVLLSIPFLSPIEPATAMAPFCFVLLISIIRELVEDLKKASYDKLYNNSKTAVFNTKTHIFQENSWKDVTVGSILRIHKNELIPADLLILKSSAANGFCYMQTSSLDGESGLKPREAIVKFQNLINEEKHILKLKGEILVDQPNENIYSINGNITGEANETIYFSITNTLLRGGILKNVDYIFGLVIYTGRESKIMKNIKKSSVKLSSIERKLNKIIIYVILITIVICSLCTALGFIFWMDNRPNPDNPSEIHAEYLFYSKVANQGVNEGFKIFGSFFTIFNTLIPISVMITLEVVKGLQIFIMDQDTKLREKFGEKSKILSMKLHEDLGNIKYVFTDKTGTLTKNEMEFKACSIFTMLYEDNPTGDDSDDEEDENLNFNNNNNPAFSEGNGLNKKSIFTSTFDPVILKESLSSDLPLNINDAGSTPFLSVRESSIEFFLNLALNHNVLTETDNETGEKYYSGSSPDEVVLVQAAKEIGIEFIERSGDVSKVKILDKEYQFKILQRFEYTSDRKRSSIIVRDQFGLIKLYMKGADKVIIEKIDNYSKEFILKSSKEHLDRFCKGGLRTLVYSMKMISEHDYNIWSIEFSRIQEIVLKDKSRKTELETKIEEIETKMILMGSTALEDKLQNDVKGVLNDFLEADINVWMLTGDQLDTAESIGYSCKLFNYDTEIFKLRDGYKIETVMEILKKILLEMEKTEDNMLNYKIEKRRKFRLSNKEQKMERKDIIVNAHSQIKHEIENLNKPQHYNFIQPHKNSLNNNILNGNNVSTTKNYNQFNINMRTNTYTQRNDKLKNLLTNQNYANNNNPDTNEKVFNSPINPIVKGINSFNQKNEHTLNSNRNNTHNINRGNTYNVQREEPVEKKYLAEDKNEGESYYKNIKSKKVLQNVAYSNRYDYYKADFNKLRQNLELSGNSLYVSQQINNLRKIRQYNESSNNYNYNNITNSSLAKGIGNNASKIKRKNSQIPININQLNAGEIKFIGGNLDKNTNKITLNFVKNSQNSFNQGNRPMTPGISNTGRPISASILSQKKNQQLAFNQNANLPNTNLTKNNAGNQINLVGNEYNGLPPSEFEDSQNYEPNDTTILRYMVDIDFFENNKNNQNYTFIKNIIGENVQASKMNKNGVIEIKPIEIKNAFNNLNGNNFKKNENEEYMYNNNNIELIGDHISNRIQHNSPKYTENIYFNTHQQMLNNYQNVNDNDHENNNEDSKNLNLDNLLEYYKSKVLLIESRRSQNPLDFVIRDEKKDFSITNFGIIIEGNAIMQCLNPEIYPIFWEIIIKCRAVICCRCTPNFKSNIVEFVKKMSGEITLAIGDGGNDVNMIKAAHIGVGIFGKEGHQAAFNSDYAISQFKYLERLLFYHGRYSILRNSYFINFFFFKNLIFTFPQFWFSIFSGFSGALLWDDWYYLGYNSYISTLPAACRMLFEEDLDIAFNNYKDKNLLEFLIPDIYKQTRESRPFNIPKFFFVFFGGFVHSIAIYFIPYFIYRNNVIDQSGRGVTIWDHSLAGYFSVLAVQYGLIFEDTFLINCTVIGFNILQFGITLFFILIYNSSDGMQVGGILFDIISNLQIWLVILLTSAICVMPYIFTRRWEALFSIDLINNLRKNKYEQDYNKKTYIQKIENMTKYTRSIAKFKKIFNLKDDYEPENLVDKKVKAAVDDFKTRYRQSKILNLNKKDYSINNNNILNIHKIINSNQQNIYNNKDITRQNFHNFEEVEVKGLNNQNYDFESATNKDNNFNDLKRKNTTKIYNSTFLPFEVDNAQINTRVETKKRRNSNINIYNSSNNIPLNVNNFSRQGTNSQAKNILSHIQNVHNEASIMINNNPPLKNKSSSNTQNQNTSSNNYNYNYIHPYDEEDLINEHLGGKFKPITMTSTRRVLNPNESYDKDYRIISRDKNNKFQFNFNKIQNNIFNNENNINNNNNNKILIENHKKETIKNGYNINDFNDFQNLINDDDLRNLMSEHNFDKLDNLDLQENGNMNDNEDVQEIENNFKDDLSVPISPLKQTSNFFIPDEQNNCNNELKKSLVKNEIQNEDKSSSSVNEYQLKNKNYQVKEDYNQFQNTENTINKNNYLNHDENFEMKNFTLKQSHAIDQNTINNFTFKKPTDATHIKLKSLENYQFDEINQINKSSEIIGIKHKNHIINHEYPLDITHSLANEFENQKDL